MKDFNIYYGCFDECTEILDKFGQEELGRFHWSRQTTQYKKLKEIFKALEDQDLLKHRMGATNFERLMSFFHENFGKEESQADILDRQLEFEASNLGLVEFISHLTTLHEKCNVLGREPRVLKECFWKKYGRFEDDSFKNINGMDGVVSLSIAMEALIAYHIFSESSCWKDEIGKICEAMRSLVERQIKLAIEMEQTHRQTVGTNEALPNFGWRAMSALDWLDLFLAILVCDGSKFFIQSFGASYKPVLQKIVLRIHSSLDASVGQASLNGMTCPKSLQTPGHWGHVTWRYCEFMEKLDFADRLLTELKEMHVLNVSL